MRALLKWIVIGAGLSVFVFAGVIAAAFVVRHLEMQQEWRVAKATVEAHNRASSGMEPGSLVQLPKITARAERDGLVVNLRNDTSNRRVVIDPEKDHLVVELETVSSAPAVRVVGIVNGGTLALGEGLGPIFIPFEGRWESGSVRFVHLCGPWATIAFPSMAMQSCVVKWV